MGTFKTYISVVNRSHYVLVREGDDGTKHGSPIYTFDELVHELRGWLPIYPPLDCRVPGPRQTPSPLAPEPICNTPADAPLPTPSRFQLGSPVSVAGTVVGVLFREGNVNYEVALGTTDALGEPDVTLVRSYDVEPRVMEHIGGEWR